MVDETLEQEGTQQRRGGALKWILILLILLGLGGGGYFAYTEYIGPKFFAEKGSAQSEGEQDPFGEESKRMAEEVKGYKDLVSLPSFLVNLADPLGRRYLKLSLDVEVVDEGSARELDRSEAKVRDSIILLLSSKSYQDLSSIESKILLKKEIVERLNQILGGPRVLRVYITEMVVQ